MKGIEQHVDWAAPPRATDERAGRSPTARGGSQKAPDPGRDVMETLLGKNNLVAIDVSGGDPYNATGRFVRR